MKAISIRQPWTWAIVHAGKSIENRSRNVVGSYRGPVLIHAAKTLASIREWTNALNRIREINPRMPITQYGGIVARAEIINVLPPYAGREYTEAIQLVADLRWWERDHFGIVLASVVPLPFVPWKGRLGLFDVPDNYASLAAGTTP